MNSIPEIQRKKEYTKAYFPHMTKATKTAYLGSIGTLRTLVKARARKLIHDMKIVADSFVLKKQDMQ